MGIKRVLTKLDFIHFIHFIHFITKVQVYSDAKGELLICRPEYLASILPSIG